MLYSHWGLGCARRRGMTVTTRQSSLSVTRPVNNGTFTILWEGIYVLLLLTGGFKSAQLFQQIEGPRMSLVQALRNFAKSRWQFYKSPEFSSSRAAAHWLCHNCTELRALTSSTQAQHQATSGLVRELELQTIHRFSQSCRCINTTSEFHPSFSQTTSYLSFGMEPDGCSWI